MQRRQMMRRRVKNISAESIPPARRSKLSMQKPGSLGTVLFIVCWWLGGICGCHSRTDRLAVSGAITLNGQPLDGATIRFAALDGAKFATGAMVHDGRFNIPKDKGLRPGRYHVEINAPDDNAPRFSSAPVPGSAASGPRRNASRPNTTPIASNRSRSPLGQTITSRSILLAARRKNRDLAACFWKEGCHGTN